VKSCERPHPVMVTVPGVQTTGTEPHSLEAVTLAEHAGSVGLQPHAPPVGKLLAKITGAVTSCQVYVTTAGVALNPLQPSVAVYVKVCELLHPFVTIVPGVQMTGETGPHSLEAVTPASQDGSVDGLQPSAPPVGTLASIGAVTSCQVYVTTAGVALNPLQASVAV
jgi:hypothetical protein